MYPVIMLNLLRERIVTIPVAVGVGVWVASLTLYVSTLAPTLTWGWKNLGVDGGELLSAAGTLGVPHPPGYPTYTLLLRLFTTVAPVGDFAYRGNLLSAVLASTAVFTIYWVILRLCLHLRPGAPIPLRVAAAALGALALATSPLFWSQAVITEVYSLNALFTGLLLLVALHSALPPLDQARQEGRRTTVKLALFGFLLGVGLGNHLTLLVVAAPLACWLWTAVGRKMLDPRVIGALVLGLAIYAYIPISAANDPPVSWGNADTLGGFVWMLTGGPYGGYVFDVPTERILSCSSSGCSGRLITWVEMAFTQFNPLGLFFGVIGAAVLRRKAFRLLLVALVSITILSVYAITYNTVDFEVLLVPVFLLFSVWIGVGFLWTASVLVESALRRWRSLSIVGIKVSDVHLSLALGMLAVLLLPATAVAFNYGSQDLSDDRGAHDYASQLLDSVPDGSVLISERDTTVFSLWYMRYVDRPERDVAPVVVPLLQFDWYQRDIQRMFPRRVPEKLSTTVDGAVRDIVEYGGGTGVYFTFTSRFLSDSFDVEQIGEVYAVRPRK